MSTRPFASILLALLGPEGWRYAGRVGSGFDAADFAELGAALEGLEIRRSALSGPISQAVARQAKSAIRVTVQGGSPIAEEGSMANEESVQLAEVRLTHPDKVLFPEQGVTKRQLAEYFKQVSERMLPHLERRLVSLVRCPRGHGKKCFFQRHASAGFPEHFHELEVTEKDGNKSKYLYLVSLQGLVASAQLGVLELHIWGSRIDRLEAPDRLVFDLDPDAEMDFKRVRAAAAHLRDALQALELRSFALVTGGKGIHVVVPLMRRHDWGTVKAFARAMAQRFASDDPDQFVATMSKSKRNNRIFIDYLRNERGASAIAPYSPRASKGAPLAWPVTWERLAELDSAQPITLDQAAEAVQQPDPWEGYAELRQSLRKHSLKALGVQF